MAKRKPQPDRRGALLHYSGKDFISPRCLSEPSLKNHIFPPCVYYAAERADHRAASTPLPRHNSPGQNNPRQRTAANPPASPAATTHLEGLSLRQCPSRYCPSHGHLGGELVLVPGPRHGGNCSLDCKPDVSGTHGHTIGRGILRENKQERRETMPSLPFLYLFSASVAHCALKALWEWSTWRFPEAQSVAAQLDSRWRDCRM